VSAAQDLLETCHPGKQTTCEPDIFLVALVVLFRVQIWHANVRLNLQCSFTYFTTILVKSKGHQCPLPDAVCQLGQCSCHSWCAPSIGQMCGAGREISDYGSRCSTRCSSSGCCTSADWVSFGVAPGGCDD
jgi:hypothetical protein